MKFMDLHGILFMRTIPQPLFCTHPGHDFKRRAPGWCGHALGSCEWVAHCSIDDGLPFDAWRHDEYICGGTANSLILRMEIGTTGGRRDAVRGWCGATRHQ